MSDLSDLTTRRDAPTGEARPLRVLMLAQMVVFPADAGPKVKTLQVLRYLAARHEVVYCAFARTPQEHQHAEALRPLCRRLVTVQLTRSRLSDAGYLATSMATGEPFLLRRDNRAAMRNAVERLLVEERIDAIHVDQLNMMQFVPPTWNGPIILDEHNAVWLRVERLHAHAPDPLRRWLLGREARLIQRAEADACRRAQVVLAVSDEDRASLAAITEGRATIETVPIAIDGASYEPLWRARRPQPDRVLTIGTMFSPPNSEGVAWWLREGYQLLRALRPDVTYDIVGPRPPAFLCALATNFDGVRLHGYVDDPAPFWTSASLLAVPLLSGGGVRVKILEAMAVGVPVVSTAIGCEGLAVRHSEHLLIADTPYDFARACANLLSDSALAQRLAENARQLILERYDAAVALAPLDQAYAAVSAHAAQPLLSQ